MAHGRKEEELETNIEDGLVELIYIDPSGKQINITDEIPVEVEPISRLDSIEIFKDSLILTIQELKNTIEFQRNELHEKKIPPRLVKC